MEKHFIDFLGRFFIAIAKEKAAIPQPSDQGIDNQELNQLDKITMIGEALANFEVLAGMFKLYYGLDNLSEEKTEEKELMEKWQNSMSAFLKSIKTLQGQMHMVPIAEHLALVKKYEDLKTRLEEKEEYILTLQLHSEQTGKDSLTKFDSFHDLLKKQGDQIQEFLKLIGKIPDKNILSLNSDTSTNGQTPTNNDIQDISPIQTGEQSGRTQGSPLQTVDTKNISSQQ